MMTDDNSIDTEANAAPAAVVEPDRAAAQAAEIASLKDKLLRTLAEMENLRRRTDREISDARQYAVASFARDMLVVGDNLRRAIAAVPTEAAKADPALSALIEGVEVTERGLEQSLEKFGVRTIDAKGQKFDPGLHQSIYQVDASDLPAGSVAEVIQAGYVIGDRVLRPALVAVVKEGQKPGLVSIDSDDEPAPAEAETTTISDEDRSG
jgi:molecular chaperone GrpE